MKIFLVRGRGVVSRLIQFQTRSPYSHTALGLRDGSVVEAREFTGVRRLESQKAFLSDLKPGTVVEVYEVPLVDEDSAEAFVLSQVGMSYDYVAVARFLTRVPARENKKWFCSELVAATAFSGHTPLLRGDSQHMSPRDIALSPLLPPAPNEAWRL